MTDLFPTFKKDVLCKCGEELDENNYCLFCDILEAEKRLEQMEKLSVLYVKGVKKNDKN